MKKFFILLTQCIFFLNKKHTQIQSTGAIIVWQQNRILMMKKTAHLFLAIFLITFLSCNQSSKENNNVDAIYFGGDILTMEGDSAVYAESVAIKDGKIVFVGSKEDAEKMKGEFTLMKDLQGKTLLPGFIDAHSHVSMTGLQAASANLLPAPDGNGNSIDSLIAITKRWVTANPDATTRVGWIVGFGYDESQLKEKRNPVATDLDKISTTLPVIFIHQSGHLGAINHKAMEVLGLNKDTNDPAGGVYGRLPGSTELSGALEENAFFMTVPALLSKLTQEDQDYLLAQGQKLYASFGFTTAQDGRTMPAGVNTFIKAANEKNLIMDIVSYPDILVASSVMKEPWLSKDYNNHFRIGGVKMNLDGSPQGKTVYLTKPYKVVPSGQPENYRGYPTFQDDEVIKNVDKAFENNWQLITHCGGDAAADQFIKAVRIAEDKYGKGDRRTVMIHAHTVRDDQLDSMKVLSIIPSFFSMHTYYWGDWHVSETMGKERAFFMSPTHSALKKGILFTEHHDAPVAFPDALRVLDATVNRVSRTGVIIGPDERVSPYIGLLAITRWAAYQYFEENHKGSIKDGKLADFVILEKNPLKVDPLTIHTISILETIKEGKTIFKKEL